MKNEEKRYHVDADGCANDLKKDHTAGREG
jgi:hypothetical protein